MPIRAKGLLRETARGTAMSISSEQELTPAEREQLDAVCDAFEQQWRRHQLPQVEESLDGCAEPLRSVLLEELLRIDSHWRGQTTDAERLRSDYLRRFPANRREVEGVFGSSAEESTALHLQHDSLGPFRDLERIGDGGFGIVFRAWDTRHQRPVALKIPRFGQQLAGRELEQFLREAKAAGSLDHPHIARVWDSGTTADVTYIAYQLIEGENLKTRNAEFATREPREIANFVRQIVSAVHYAHQQGIVHRDIKPSNVLLTADDEPILADFGLALALGGDATRSLAGRIGTLDYMSPEQATGAQHEVDQRTDLWSLGVVLYELLTGELPFQGATDIQLCNNICNSAPKRLRQHRRSIPRDLEVVVQRCLEKRPADRLESCAELANELQRIATGKPIQSRRVTFVERAYRWCRRNPKPLTAFAAILLATMFGTWSWGLRLADNRENENAVQQLQLQLEVKNIERRQLLSDLMQTDTTKVPLLDQDIEFLENTLRSSKKLHERIFSALALAHHFQRVSELSAVPASQREEVEEALQNLLSQPIKDEEQAKIRAALQAMESLTLQ